MRIGKTLNGEDFSIDTKRILSERTFICSLTRYGKSWTARRIVEEVFGKVGIVIFDGEGEYTSLRELYPFLIIGRDIPVNIDTAEFLAEQVLKENLSVICDFSTTDVIDTQQFVTKFVNKFMELETTMRKSYLFIIEEADEYMPEKSTFKSLSLRAMINIAKKGAKRGIGMVMISQRPAFVSKYALSQCVNKIIGHIEWTGDLKVIKDFLRLTPEIMDKLPTLKEGEFYFQGNFIEAPDFVKVGGVRTEHMGRTPNIIPPTTKELENVVERLKENLPKIIEEIKPTIIDQKKIEDKIKKEIGDKYKDRVAKLEERLVKTAEVSEEEIENRIDEKIDEYRGKSQKQDVRIKELERFVASIVNKGRQFLDGENVTAKSSEVSGVELNYDVWLNKFKGGKRTILELLIKYRKLTRSQLTIMSGMKSTNINHNILPVLKSAGIITYDKNEVRLVS